MRTLTSCFCAAALLVSTEAYAGHQYYPVGIASHLVVFVDTQTIARDGTSIVAWSLWINDPPTAGVAGNMSHSMMQDRYDCATRQSTTLHAASYAKDGTVLSSEAFFKSPEPVIPDSMAETVFTTLCQGIPKNAKSFDDIETARTFAHLELMLNASAQP